MKLLLSNIIILIALAGCMPQSTRVLEMGAGQTIDDGTTTVSDVELAWYKDFTNQQVVSFHRDQQSHLYLKGVRIETFIKQTNNPTASYCLEVDMGSSIPASNKRYLLVRAIPVSVNNVGTGKKTLFMRVDFGNTSASTAVCQLPKLQYVDDTNTQTVAFSALTTSFSVTDVCVSCVSSITSSGFRLFTVEPTRLVQVPPRNLNFAGISMSILPGTTPGTGGSCTASACQALGYDCCSGGQCVRDGQVKNGVNTTTDPEFTAAQNDVLQNPLAFMNYPQYYYICGTGQATTGGSSGGGTSDPEAEEQQRKADFLCVEHMKNGTTDVPYLRNPFTPTITNPALCERNDAASPVYYLTVLDRLYNACASPACVSAYPNLNDRITNCGAWHYEADSSYNLSCTPLSEAPTTTPTIQNVSVSSRSVPHRFFNQGGSEVDVTTNIPANTIQEGTTFRYNDPEKMQPQNGTFNMNSALGQMTLALDQAQPAKVVKVDLDKVYRIAVTTVTGHSTCPTCAKDSWFPSFRAFPTTSRGRGLQSRGYSTQRDQLDGNTTLGNYEDTLFGRACWVPPTMLPFSQPLDMSSEATQRTTRLKVQAAMWANGYQRDWYGFNRGALIGSFDGVKWFAVGKGRIIRSTSPKLFLAINSPFGDLALNSAHMVLVQEHDSQSQGASTDHDPNLDPFDPTQTEAASCQQHHLCEVDRDCVTQLGWEYVCADVNPLKTFRPDFNPANASEILSLSVDATATGVAGMLASGMPVGSNKRCVYRGAGAVCRTDAGSIPNTELDKRKLLTCAPNFWCADASGSNSIVPGVGTAVKTWNKEVARFNGLLEEMPISRNHKFGQDANILGRPLDYTHSTSGSSSLLRPSDAQISGVLNNNVRQMDNAAFGKVGLCRPGKQLPTVTDVSGASNLWNPFNQHKGLDSFSRTDFISQIASCPSSYLSVNKTVSCPVLDDTGNYLHQTTAFDSQTITTWGKLAAAQNSCGLETLRTGTALTGTADQLLTKSPFQSIEAKPLNAAVMETPGVARDACLRRAGSACFSDYDCGPNEMHANATANFADTSYWGNLANLAYYSEPLICGQGQAKPNSTDTTPYDITQNRCCRAIGADVSTYSTHEPSGVNSDAAASSGLDPLRPGQVDPTFVGRYERFASVANLGTDANFPVLTASDTRDAGTGVIIPQNFGSPTVTTGHLRTSKQWNTLNKVNSQTCCGGGWIRKFADGTNNWAVRNRLKIDVENFQCLNYITPLVGDTAAPSTWGMNQFHLDRDYGSYCTDVQAAIGGCAQRNIPKATNLDLAHQCAARETGIAGVAPYNNAQFSTLPNDTVAFSSNNNIFAFFKPVTGDNDPMVYADYGMPGGRRNITIFLPSYVGSGMNNVQIQRRDSSNNSFTYTCTDVGTGNTLIGSASDVGSCGVGGCCYEYDSGSRQMKVAIRQSVPYIDGVLANSGTYGVRVTFTPPGIGASPGPQSKLACTEFYYLEILGRMELSGIPQITYPKIVCNNDNSKLVPNLYTAANRTAFNTNANSFVDPVTGDRHTNFHGLNQDPVFSSHDFKCCTPLGMTTTTPSNCCSGYGEEYQDPTQPPAEGVFQCKMPLGTNISVYFNRFVSNEALNADLPGGGLTTLDFDQTTGEPRSTNVVNAKIISIASELCAEGSRIRRGGAFGDFLPEPASPSGSATIYGIVDSSADVGTSSSGGVSAYPTGSFAFKDGFRWNHHIYCGDP